MAVRHDPRVRAPDVQAIRARRVPTAHVLEGRARSGPRAIRDAEPRGDGYVVPVATHPPAERFFLPCPPACKTKDWGAFLAEEMTTSTRLNAFLWNRISQGYARLVQDGPPHASWHAWRRGGPSRDLSPALYRTPPPPSPGQRSCLSEEEAPDSAASGQEEVVGGVEVEGGNTAAAASDGAARRNAAAIRCSATICEVDNNVDCGDVQAGNFDGSVEWAPPLPMSDLSQGARRILFTVEVPNNMAVTELLCTVSGVDNVSNEHRKSKMALRTSLGTDSARRDTVQGRSGLTTRWILGPETQC